MRQQTQMLLMQNYEKVKQAMLSGTDTDKAVFIQKFVVKEEVPEEYRNNKPVASKKRTLDQISGNRDSANTEEFRKDGISENYIPGRFRFKHKEGHSKNFKRELTFEWFL